MKKLEKKSKHLSEKISYAGGLLLGKSTKMVASLCRGSKKVLTEVGDVSGEVGTAFKRGYASVESEGKEKNISRQATRIESQMIKKVFRTDDLFDLGVDEGTMRRNFKESHNSELEEQIDKIDKEIAEI